MGKYSLKYGKGQNPLYAQVKEIILKNIKDGIYIEKIPTERELEELFGVSRMTIRLAVDELVKEGYLLRERAKGTRILNRKISENINSLRNFSSEMKSKNIEYEIHKIEMTIIKADSTIAEALEIEENTNVYSLTRVYYTEGEPFCLIISYLPSELNLSVDESVYKKSLYDYLEREKGVIVTKSYEDIEVGFADDLVSKELKINIEDEVLFRTRKSFDQDNHHVEYTLSYYKPGKYKYSLVLTK